MQGRKVPLDQRFREIVRADLINVNAWETVVLPVPAEVAFIYPVVSKGAEVEDCKIIALIAERYTS